MATFLQLQNRVKTRLIDLPSAVEAEVPTLVNSAIREIEDRHHFKVMEATTGQLTTTINTRTLSSAVPSDFKSLRGKPYLVENTGFTKPLLVTTAQENALDAYDVSGTIDVGQPEVIVDPYFSDENSTRTWEVYPAADGNSDWSDGEYRVVIPYWRYLTDLSADGDTNWFTTNAVEFILRWATAEGFFLNEEEERAAVWFQRAEQQVATVVKADKLYRLGATDHIAIQHGANAPRLRA